MLITRSPLRVTLGGGGTDLPSYYKKKNGSIFELIKADTAPTQMYGASELKEHVQTIAKKLDLPLKQIISGSSI